MLHRLWGAALGAVSAFVQTVVGAITALAGTSELGGGRIIVRCLMPDGWRLWSLPSRERSKLGQDSVKYHNNGRNSRRALVLWAGSGFGIAAALVVGSVIFGVEPGQETYIAHGAAAAAVLVGLFIGNHASRSAVKPPEHWVYGLASGRVAPILPQDEEEDRKWREYARRYRAHIGIKDPEESPEDAELPRGSPRSSQWFNPDFMCGVYEARDEKASLMGTKQGNKKLMQAGMAGIAALAVGAVILTSMIANDEADKRNTAPVQEQASPLYFPPPAEGGG